MFKFSSAIFLALSLLLTGCGKPADDPTPTAETVERNRETRLAATQLGEPLEVDGCQVKVHEVYVTRPGVSLGSSFKMATADCSASKVISTQETCGKGCVHNTVRVDRLSEAEMAAKQATAQQAAKRRKELEARIAELQRQLLSEQPAAELIGAQIEVTTPK